MSAVEPTGDLPGGFEDYRVITIAYDAEQGRPIYNIGDMDDWSAVTVLEQVADAIRDRLPAAVAWDQPSDNEEIG